jgi:drug/metabolite transporter (DMT)-like permease
MAFVTALLWGTLPILLRVALLKFSTVFVVWCRFAIAFVALLCVLSWRGREPLAFLRRPPRLALLAGLLLSCNYYGFLLGIKYSGASNAGILIQSGGLILVVLGMLFFNERLGWRKGVGFAIALVGLYIFFADREAHAASADNHLLGSLCTIASAFAWALYAACLKALPRDTNPQLLNLVVFAIGAVLYGAFLHTAEFALITPLYALLLILLGFNTFLAYTALAESLRAISTADAMVIITANPLITLCALELMSWIPLRIVPAEPITWFGYLGAAIAIGGVIMVVGKGTTRARA